MNPERMRDYLAEWAKRPLPPFSPRDLRVPTDGKFVISLVGPRRAGKTFYFYQLISQLGKEQSLYLNFEDTRLEDISAREIREVLRQHIELSGTAPRFIFLDEIQRIAGWEAAVRELHDTFQYVIFLTGSSSRLLGKEVATQLRGRALSYLFLPFSFSEFLRFKGAPFAAGRTSKDEESRIRHLLRDYLEFGGFPDVASAEMKEKVLREYFDALLFKDVVERHAVQNLHVVSLIFKQLVNAFSREFSVHALYQSIKGQGVKVAKGTIYKYLNYFEDSLAVFLLRRHAEKPKLRESWPRKVYLPDTGFSKALGSSGELGKLMENAVFLQLLRTRNINPFEISYWKDTAGKEVDFVLHNGSQADQLIQVTYASAPEEMQDREIRNLLAAAKRIRCRNLLVITWDYRGEQESEGGRIIFMPLWRWLLQETTLEGSRIQA